MLLKILEPIKWEFCMQNKKFSAYVDGVYIKDEKSYFQNATENRLTAIGILLAGMWKKTKR